ncbi:hypothetical protein PAECIP111890_02445 [Paenibacillus sp. JJ-223]|nr:hypothetical protein PAECIP111890_02445 [Paenibacillus sp. JJ-223]
MQTWGRVGEIFDTGWRKIKKAARHAVFSNVKIIDKHRSDAQLQSKQLLC